MIRPPLTIVDPGSNLPSPPRKLGAHGLDLWAAIMREYCITDPGGLELLVQACGALDRVEELGESGSVWTVPSFTPATGRSRTPRCGVQQMDQKKFPHLTVMT